MPLHHVRLELARDPDSPHGDSGDGYDLVLPLNEQSRLDADAILASPDTTRVRRFRGGETLAVGQLTRGSDGAWILDFPGEDSDASGFRLEDEGFVIGEYVSLAEPRQRMRPYRVTLVQVLNA